MEIDSQQDVKNVPETSNEGVQDTTQKDVRTPYKAVDVREDFIKYFRANSHKLLQPSKIFNNDPTLLFVNAGMNQLKSEFLKDIAPEEEKEEKFRRLCNSQICIRAGGKHNDLDDVGLDSYHLTSFEMLGNWSINSYQKEEAIRLAYGYLVDHLKLDPRRMYVTYFKGDDKEGVLPDNESRDIWSKYLPVERIVQGNFKDNFWMMADTGPCGVCTEIHYDLNEPGDGFEPRCVPELVNQDDPRVIEIWNIVFIQFNRKQNPDNSASKRSDYVYDKLERFFVDTGMGMERLCMVLQKKPSIYKTDVFHYLMGYAQAISNCEKSYSDCYDPTNENYSTDCAYRIFCDHFRTVVTALFDGVDFDSTGRGHVLRKIFRRLLSYTYKYLNGGVVKQIMNRPIVLGIITDVLNYQLKYTHDNVAIREKLINEEKLFLGCLQNFKRKMITVLEENEEDGAFDYVCMKNDPKLKDKCDEHSRTFVKKHLENAENLYSRLMRDGVPPLLVKYSNTLVIHPIKN
ncbi:alanyl-trna synthetase [Yasminevirus sp. GU-2018]|uniref:alanine--tRNA ligase n=1 Tax=Yasminevirus sp. GU-2018 TaxID=2420051 RepID=A0A5K0U818_9VIRU|nr:alanyl-trna synthetase [Yasminevirus sp. GU-2018]